MSRTLLKCPRCNVWEYKGIEILGERAAMLGVFGAIYHELQQQEQDLQCLEADGHCSSDSRSGGRDMVAALQGLFQSPAVRVFSAVF